MTRRLLYIVFIIITLSSCQEDNSILFVDYIRQFEESSYKFDQKNGIIYKDYDYLLFEYPAKIAPWQKRVAAVKENKIKLVQLIDSIQSSIDTIVIKKIINHDVLRSFQLNKKVRLKKEDADIIQKAILSFKKAIIPLIQDTVKYSELKKKIEKDLTTNPLNKLNAFNARLVTTVELLACFSKIKSDIKIAESGILNYLSAQVDFDSFSFRNIEAIVVPNSKNIPVGTPYKANILLAVYDSTSTPTFEVDGKKYRTTSGIGIYKFKVTEKPGIYAKDGNFLVKSPATGEIQKCLFTIEYEVLERK